VNELLNFLHDVDPSLVFLVFLSVLTFSVVWSWHRNEDLDFQLQQILVDNTTGKIAIEKVGYMTALAIGTWGFVSMTLKGGMTEWYFTIYMSVFVAGRMVSQGIAVTKDIKTGPPNDRPV
jgi:hypothetical protein